MNKILAENIVSVVKSLKRPANMDMVFNYLTDVFSYQSVRNYNYGNSWYDETTNEGELKCNTQTTATPLF